MTQATQREIRVFLSSTFRDMDAERHYLVTRVFPEIRQICYQRMINFSEIDLRWGITEEAAHNGRTVQICLEEIERCRSLGIPPSLSVSLASVMAGCPRLTILPPTGSNHRTSATPG
jgi:hypothetical protein